MSAGGSAAAREGAAFYVVPGTVAETGKAKAADVLQMQTVLVDLDAGDIAAKLDHLIAGDDIVPAHAGSPQQRSAHGHIRHSWKSRVVAMRGSRSHASVA